MQGLTSSFQSLQVSAPQTGPVLMPHQVKALEFVRLREKDLVISGGFLGMQMGMGKTLTMLSHLAEETEQKSPTLVACPKTAMLTWKQEITKHYQGRFSVLLFRKDEAKLETLTAEDISNYDIVITNYDYIRSLCKRLDLFDRLAYKDSRERIIGANISYKPICNVNTGEALLFSTRWGRIIADESHNFSNFKTALWQSMMCLCSKFKWCLSGTPIRNICDDLYAQYKFLGYRDGKFDIKAFRSLKIDKYIFYMNYEIAGIKLPEVNHVRVPIVLEEQNLKIYNYYLEKANEAYDSFTVGTTDFVEVLTLFIRLRQVCLAPWTVTPDLSKLTKQAVDEYELSQIELDELSEGLSLWINEKNGTAGMKAPKILKTIELINSVPRGEKVIVFTMFKKVIDLLSVACCDRSYVVINGDIVGKQRESIITSFKRDDIDVLFISYKIGAESLNLTEANHIILLEPWWCPAVIDQAKSRVHRLGQNKTTNLYELYISNNRDFFSIEEAILEYCDGKRAKAAEFYEQGKMDPEYRLNAQTLGAIISKTHCKIKPRQT
jgi:SNF2 family DNA or RNA helicase